MVYLETIPNFLLFFGACLAYAAVFLAIYTRVTPWNEPDIEAGRTATAATYAAFALGVGLLNAACMT